MSEKMQTHVSFYRRDRAVSVATVFVIWFTSLAAFANAADQVARYFAGDQWIEFVFDDSEIMYKGNTPPPVR